MAWNGSDGVKAPQIEKKAPNGIKGVIAGVIIIVLAIAVFYGIRSVKSEEGESETKSTKIADVNPVKIVHRGEVEPTVEKSKDGKRQFSPRVVEKLSKLEKILKARMANTNGTITLSKPLLKNPTDQLYYEVFSTELGDMPPMTPKLVENQEIEALNAIHSILKTDEKDSELEANAKDTVNQVKELLDGYIKDGGTINEFFDYYCYQLETAFEMRQQAVVSLNDVVNEDYEVAVKYLDKVNERLEKEGIKPIDFNNAQKAILELKRNNSEYGGVE